MTSNSQWEPNLSPSQKANPLAWTPSPQAVAYAQCARKADARLRTRTGKKSAPVAEAVPSTMVRKVPSERCRFVTSWTRN